MVIVRLTVLIALLVASCGAAEDATMPTTPKHPEPGHTTFIAVSAGMEHSCGIRTDATAVCWGRNDAGQANTPRGRFTAITAGEEHSCGIRTDATVTCWGRNDAGQTDAPRDEFTAITAGQWHSCGIRTDATAVCWGDNSLGQATDAPLVDSPPSPPAGRIRAGSEPTEPLPAGAPDHYRADAPEGHFTAITTGGYHSCGIRTDATALLGDGPLRAGGRTRGPLHRHHHRRIDHSCGIRTDATAVCWGMDHYGQDGRTRGPVHRHHHRPVNIRAGSEPTQPPSVGGWTTTGRRTHPRATSPPSPPAGITRAASEPTRPLSVGVVTTPGRQTHPEGHFTAITADEYHSCGIRTDRTVTCWAPDGPRRAGRRTRGPLHRHHHRRVSLVRDQNRWHRHLLGSQRRRAGEYTPRPVHRCLRRGRAFVRDQNRCHRGLLGRKLGWGDDCTSRSVHRRCRRRGSFVRHQSRRYCHLLGLQRIRASGCTYGPVHCHLRRERAFVRDQNRRDRRLLGRKRLRASASSSR